jgi:hypothetical protein
MLFWLPTTLTLLLALGQVKGRAVGSYEKLKGPSPPLFAPSYSPIELMMAQGAGDAPTSIAYNKITSADKCIGGGEYGSCDDAINVIKNQLNKYPSFNCANKVCYRNPANKTPRFPPFGL